MRAILLLLALAAGQPADFVREEQTELLAFSYGWPAAAETLPALRETLRADMEAERSQALRWAEESRVEARENGFEFLQHYYAKTWEAAGATPQLLSLTALEEAFAGGAHGNTAFASLLWDRAADRPAMLAEVLGPAVIAGMTGRYCAALDAERAARREAPVRPDPADPHTLCPPLTEQTLAAKDTDGNGRFDTLDVLIAPYVAGPYAEGLYFAEVPLEAPDLSAVPPEYSAAFETAAPETGEAPSADARCGEGDMDLPRGRNSVCVARLNDDYAFAMAWPREAAEIPALDALLRQEAERNEQWLRRQAAEATGERSEGRDEPLRFSFEQSWSVDANLPELVAASGSAQDHTGGAHGGLAYHVILIDRRRGERIRLGGLFADPAAGLVAVHAGLCTALAAAVFERRGGSEDEYECPTAAEHPVTLVCGAGPRIDLMVALLDPYVIGAWAEGPYEIAFPVTPQIIAALRPEFRAAFAVAREAPAQPPTQSRCSGGSRTGWRALSLGERVR